MLKFTGIITGLDRIYSDLKMFRARALEEVNRAKRYATFVSMLALDLTHFDDLAEIQNFQNLDDFLNSLRRLIKGSIRETDLISIADRSKIFILLLETPRDGASAVANRLRDSVRYFLCNNIKSPNYWKVSTREYYFPSSDGDGHDLQIILDQINAG